MYKYVWLNIILFVSIIVLITSLILTSDEELTVNNSAVSSIPEQDIERIFIKRNNKDNIVFEKIGGEWKIITPVEASANNDRISAILRLLQIESVAQLEAKHIELEKFQLDQPAITLQMNEYNFYFGGLSPIDRQRYVWFGETVYLIDDYLFPQLQQDVTFFIDTKLLPEDNKFNHTPTHQANDVHNE